MTNSHDIVPQIATLDQVAILVKTNPRFVHDAADDPIYDTLSDSLVWSNEFPTGVTDPEHIYGMRQLFRYRTRLILGENDSKMQEAWEYMQRLCPDWSLFLSDRRTSDLREVFLSKQSRATESFMTLFDEDGKEGGIDRKGDRSIVT